METAVDKKPHSDARKKEEHLKNVTSHPDAFGTIQNEIPITGEFVIKIALRITVGVKIKSSYGQKTRYFIIIVKKSID